MKSTLDTLFMIPRELPSYLSVAYSLSGPKTPAAPGNFLTRLSEAADRTFTLVKDLISYTPAPGDFEINKENLGRDFSKIAETVEESSKPLCIYFVSTYDHDGTILGNPLYYYHHYKIQELQKHFTVLPALVSSQDEMKEFMVSAREKYPNKEIQFIDIVAHGSKSFLEIHNSEEGPITPEQLREDLFSDSAPDATILLDAGMTGLGSKNIADEIARKTPGRTVLAPGPSMWFSKPVVQVSASKPQVVSAVHGFGICQAYECKSFSYKERMPMQHPYTTDKNLTEDILRIASIPVLRNSWLEPFLEEDREDLRIEIELVYDTLSKDTQQMVLNEFIKNLDLDYQPAESKASEMLCQDFLDPHLRQAFRTVFTELTNEVREYPSAGWAKLMLNIQSVWEVFGASLDHIASKKG